MIHALSTSNAHFYGEALPSLHRLRKRMFVDIQKWNIPTFKDMEYDAYDNPATTYLVYLNENNHALGMVRVYPTDRPYMIKDVWPETIQKTTLPSSIKIYEGSRFVIDDRLNKDLKRTIKYELVCALLEFGLENEISEYIGVMPHKFWESVFINSGWHIKKLGPTIVADDGSAIYAAQFDVSNFHLYQVKRTTNISYQVLGNYNDDVEKKKAA